MQLEITYNHNIDNLQEAVLVNDKTIYTIANTHEEIDEKIIRTVKQIFKTTQLKFPTINSDKIAESISELNIENEYDFVMTSIFAGAKAYNSSHELRTLISQKLLYEDIPVSVSVESLSTSDYLRNKYKDQPQILQIIVLMTVGLFLSGLAAFIDIANLEDKESDVEIEKIILN